MADIAKFVRDAPPGELDAVRKDIEVLTNGSHSVQKSVDSETAAYNVETFRVVTVDGRKTVLSEFNRLDDAVFFTGPHKFSVDHVTGKVSGVSPHDAPSAAAKKLLGELEHYVSEHYPAERAVDVFDTADGLVAVIVGQKLSPQNFFNGQWTGVYTVRQNKVTGKLSANVHFYEDGNVRLRSATDVDETGPAVQAIGQAEDRFETELNKALVGLNETEFKALRRQLPVTRSQMIWGKASGAHKLGRELEKR